jgi:CAAX protease family protein
MALSVPPPGSEEPVADEPRRPGLWIAPAAVLLGLCGGIFGSVLVELIGAAFGSKVAHPTPAITILSSVVFDLAFVVAALYFVALRESRRPRGVEFGYRRVRWGIATGAFLAAGIGYYVVTFVYGALFNIHGTDKLPSDFGVGTSTWALLATAAFVCVVAPICEEFFFRGFLFGVLRRMRVTIAGRQAGPWVAAVITGILFGLAHTGSVSSAQYLIPLGFLGFVLCLVRWRTGSLYPCMALHSFNNCLALGVLLNWTVLGVLALLVVCWAVIAVVTWPLSSRKAADAGVAAA